MVRRLYSVGGPWNHNLRVASWPVPAVSIRTTLGQRTCAFYGIQAEPGERAAGSHRVLLYARERQPAEHRGTRSDCRGRKRLTGCRDTEMGELQELLAAW